MKYKLKFLYQGEDYVSYYKMIFEKPMKVRDLIEAIVFKYDYSGIMNFSDERHFFSYLMPPIRFNNKQLIDSYYKDGFYDFNVISVVIRGAFKFWDFDVIIGPGITRSKIRSFLNERSIFSK